MAAVGPVVNKRELTQFAEHLLNTRQMYSNPPYLEPPEDKKIVIECLKGAGADVRESHQGIHNVRRAKRQHKETTRL